MTRVLNSLVSTISLPIRSFYHLIATYNPCRVLLQRLSLPARWAVLTFFCLSLLLGAYLIRIRFFNGSGFKPPNEDFVGVIGSLVTLFISLLVYGYIQFLLKEKPSPYSDIDRVITEGLQELADRKIEVLKTPIFLVLGTENVLNNRLVIEAAAGKPTTLAPKTGDDCLSIHASQDAIWIFPHGCNSISVVNHLATPTESDQDSDDDSLHDSIAGTMSADDMEFEAEDESARWGKTHNFDEFEPPIDGGTIQMEDDFDPMRDASASHVAPTARFNPLDLEQAEERLRHVCRWLRKIRGNVCPINGVLTAIPFEAIVSKSEHLSKAVQADLKILREELQVRVPNTLLVSGMENEPGFTTMTNLLGPHRTEKQRIGKGAHEKASPENKYLAVIAKQAASAIEDQIFDLFQQGEVLRNSNTPNLFRLLCRMRGNFGTNLIKIVEDSFGFDPFKQHELSNSQFLFGGCYFAAGGIRKKEHAFLPSVLAKVFELRSNFDWSMDAQRRDLLYQKQAAWVSLIGLSALVAIAALLAFRFRFP